ncbi:hypothetical protein FACS189490_10180 [Clostridia bacterium]|nr:hypothetical protein FACS189490_10180 [Clostridia bacterium]
MKIIALNFNAPNSGNGLEEVLSAICETLSELAEREVVKVRVFLTVLPYYDGEPAQSVFDVSEKIKQADGVIIAAPVSLGLPSALCMSFLEHLSNPQVSGALAGKNVLTLLVGQNGLRTAGEALSAALSAFSAFDPIRVIIPEKTAKTINRNAETREIIEKQAEDYYRVVRQNRKYIIPASEPAERAEKPIPTVESVLSDYEYEKLLGRKPKKQTAAELMEERGIPDRDSEDIEELSRVFIEKLKKGDNNTLTEEAYIPSPLSGSIGSYAKPRVKTAKQMTLSLPHYYQPQLAGGLNAVIQINVTGIETFSVILNISNTDCTATDGAAEERDITVTADAKVWSDVLKGKYTAQKAFMVGQLKVRGNFVLLTRFDQLFTFGMA